MSSLKAGLFAIALVTAAGTTPGHAQSIEFGSRGLRVNPEQSFDVDRRDAIRAARRVGLREIDRTTRGGRTWRVEGSDRRGRDMTVTVDARTGDVVNVDRM